MSSLRTKALLLASASMLLGVGIGAYGSRLVYGHAAPIDPEPRVECPPCPECEAEPEERVADLVVLGQEPELPAADTPPPLPGLPVAALDRAGRALASATTACWGGAPSGTGLVLDLTVTATHGEGRVRTLRTLKTNGCEAAACDPISQCISEAARALRFAWEGSDGETHLVWPLSSP
ncbi:MAG: hypothetical protein HYV07_21855 [Deltaproteobacteria bacterium]|nr:hypothetical protein [Deltaproteobacteria bacterium]